MNRQDLVDKVVNRPPVERTVNMDDEIKRYLKEHLRVELVADTKWDYYGSGSVTLEVKLLLDDEVISSDTTYTTIGD